MTAKHNRLSADTKRKLVEAAGPVFARMGFRGATVQEICERAGANIAAVNYHFGDKLGLYREVLRSARASRDRQAAGAGRNLPPEERLQVFVHALLTHLFGEGRPSWFAQVIAHEMAEPTPALKDLIELEARPGFERLKRIVCDISRLPVDDDRVVLCANSILGQCLHYFHSRAVVSELWPELRMDTKQIEAIAAHITSFSLAGVANVRVRSATSQRKRKQSRVMAASGKEKKKQ